MNQKLITPEILVKLERKELKITSDSIWLMDNATLKK